MKNINLLIILICVLPCATIAQSSQETIEPDRPSETFSPNVVPVRRFQFEGGCRKEHDNNAGERTNEFLYPAALFKYGVVKNLELRMLLMQEADYAYTPLKHKTAAGFQPVKIGMKYNFIKGKGFLPQTSVIARTSIPGLASPDFKGDFSAPLFRLVMKNEITKKLSLSYNMGEEWDDDDVHGQFFFSVAPQYEITDKLKIFAEIYGYTSKAKPAENGLDAGFIYLLMPTVQVDISGGLGMSAACADNFIEVGFAFRLPK